MLALDLTVAAYEGLLRDALVVRKKVSAQLEELNRQYPSPLLQQTIEQLRQPNDCANWCAEQLEEYVQ